MFRRVVFGCNGFFVLVLSCTKSLQQIEEAWVVTFWLSTLNGMETIHYKKDVNVKYDSKFSSLFYKIFINVEND